VLSWSYRGLDPAPARLFRRLGLHPPGPVSVAAAASLAGVPVAEAEATLAGLVHAHLLDEVAPHRYAQHDLLRAFAAELVAADDADDRADAVRRLVDHYLHTAHAATMLLNPHANATAIEPPAPGVVCPPPADAARALEWLGLERRALMAMVEQAAEAGLDRHTWQLAWSLMTFLTRSGRWSDWMATQRVGLAAARRAGDVVGQAQCHRGLGRAYIHLGRNADGRAELWEALRLLDELGDHMGAAQAQLDLAMAAERSARFDEMLIHGHEALRRYERAGSLYGQANTLNSIGWAHANLGNHRDAMVNCRLALEMLVEVGNVPGQADTWDSLGYIHRQVGELAEAVVCYRRSAALYREVGNARVEAETLVSYGECLREVGQDDEARAAWERALAIFSDLGVSEAAGVRERLRTVGTARR
jgi:tetratricopeptide (TPR) repeat protein